MSIHNGHRQRLKHRFRQEGLEHFDDLHILELLLFYCVPRQDTNPLAHRLLDKFGTLSQVLEATAEELEKVEGIGENVSTFLSLIPAVNRAYQIRREQNVNIITNLEEAGEYLFPYLAGLRNENVYMLCLDVKGKVLCCKKLGEGSINSATVPVRRIVEVALNANASDVILAHNHPGGLAIPSAEDVSTTLSVAAALRAVDIELADHIVVSDNEFISLALSGYYQSSQSGIVR